MTLRLANQDEQEIYFDMPVDATPFLDVSVDRTTLMPGEHAEVTLVFAPPEAERYVTIVPFLINGLWHQAVEVRGEGCELRLELQNPQQKQLQLGAVQLPGLHHRLCEAWGAGGLGQRPRAAEEGPDWGWGRRSLQ